MTQSESQVPVAEEDGLQSDIGQYEVLTDVNICETLSDTDWYEELTATQQGIVDSMVDAAGTWDIPIDALLYHLRTVEQLVASDAVSQ